MTLLPIPFGNPYTYKGHSGMDFPQPKGTPFRASGPGKVVTRSHNILGGYYVWVQYDNGPKVGYHHMISHAGVPPVGTRVSEGDLLGFVGNLGLHSTGPHLHMQIAGEKDGSTFWRFFDRNHVIGQAAPAGRPTGTAPGTSPAITVQEDDMATLITSPGGKSLVIGDRLFGFTGPDEANAVGGAQVLTVPTSLHARINADFGQTRPDGLPTVVYVSGGDGTVYLLAGGKLEALVDPTTLAELHAKNAPTLTLSQAEVSNLLKAS
jgi:hypothetical protein